MKIAFLFLVKIAGILLISPLFQGMIKRYKAILQGRQGPPLLQPYRDFRKFLSKERVVSTEISWVFNTAPLLAFSAVLVAALMVPWLNGETWGFPSDLILFVYLMAIPRFMCALAGLDASGAFGGMASSREMAVSALVEPALLLSLLTLALPAHSLRLDVMPSFRGIMPIGTPAGLLAGLSLFIAVIAEVGRIPVDNPDTHLELTMIHEGMILEYSGPQLGLLHLAHWVKQATLFFLLVNGFAPIGMIGTALGSGVLIGIGWFSAKLFLGAWLFALTESALVKMRLFQMMDLLGFSFVLSITALLFVAVGI